MDHFPSYELACAYCNHRPNSGTYTPQLSQLADGIYHIVNVHTGAYAALLNDDDRAEVVNITLGLNGDDDQGSTASSLETAHPNYN